jgi:hypothetical protein
MDRLLVNYLPHVLREVDELVRIMDAEQPEVVRLWGYLDDALREQFVSSAIDYGLSRWESMLELAPRGTDTIETRRFMILARLNEKLPFTIRVLRDMLAALCGDDGFDLSLVHNDYELRVLVEQSAGVDFGAVVDLLGRVVPCNLVLKLVQQLERGALPLRAGFVLREFSRDVYTMS